MRCASVQRISTLLVWSGNQFGAAEASTALLQIAFCRQVSVCHLQARGACIDLLASLRLHLKLHEKTGELLITDAAIVPILAWAFQGTEVDPRPRVDGQHELTLRSEEGQEPQCIRAKLLVNAAGLWATKIASLLTGMPEAHIPKQHYARGVYFTMAGEPVCHSCLSEYGGQPSARNSAEKYMYSRSFCAQK